jgi:predicted TIM-barrel fold metal-dependent hydrolase
MIIDTHLHVWELASQEFPWQPLATVKPDYAWPVEKQIGVMDQFGIDAGVLVQPSMYAFDNRYLLDCGQRYPDRLRLVGMVDPRSDDVESEMEALAAQGVRGLRLAAMLRPDIPWFNTRLSDRVWQKAAELNLILVLLIRPDQLLDASHSIERFPETQVMIDHLARPDLETIPESETFQQLLGLASRSQVTVKASALGFMSAQPYPHHDMIELVRQTYVAFGANRLMWGTDTPMSQKPVDYLSALRLLDIALPDAPSSAISLIKGETAHKIFGW